MALISTPPWLMPTDVIGAMSAGGRLGLGRAELAQHASDTAQRTGLGYAQIGADEASAGAKLQAQLAEHALAAALHQSDQAQQQKKEQAEEAFKGMAIQKAIERDKETARAHTAAEALKQKGLDLATKKEQDIQNDAFKKQQITLAHQRLMQAEKSYQDAVKNGKGVDEAKAHLDDVRREFDSISGGGTGTDLSGALGTAPAPSAAESLFPQVPIPGSMPPFSLQIPPGTGFIPNQTKSGNRYSIEPVGE